MRSVKWVRTFHPMKINYRWRIWLKTDAFEHCETHLTPKRSMNMIWFRKVLLMSRSICLISDEYSLACSFIFWAETKSQVNEDGSNSRDTCDWLTEVTEKWFSSFEMKAWKAVYTVKVSNAFLRSASRNVWTFLIITFFLLSSFKGAICKI